MAPSSPKPDRQSQIVAAAAAHLLAHGIHNSSLRALAGSVGTSDRMIMYYFETKEALIQQALLQIADGLVGALESLLPAGQVSAAQITSALQSMNDSAEAEAGQRLWFEIIGLSMRNEEPYKSSARQILDGWEDWISQRLGPRRAHLAPAVLAQIEGELMMKLIRQEP